MNQAPQPLLRRSLAEATPTSLDCKNPINSTTVPYVSKYPNNNTKDVENRGWFPVASPQPNIQLPHTKQKKRIKFNEHNWSEIKIVEAENWATGTRYTMDVPSYLTAIEDIMEYLDLFEDFDFVTDSLLRDRFVSFAKVLKERFCEVNIKHIDEMFFNDFIEPLLPPVIKEKLMPLKVEINDSFWSAVSMSIFATPFCGELLRCATIHYATTENESYTRMCESIQADPNVVLQDLLVNLEPTSEIKFVLSTVIERNITMFDFNQEGTLVNAEFYDRLLRNGPDQPTIFLGAHDGNYFPLIPKFTSAEAPRAKRPHSFYDQGVEITEITEEEMKPTFNDINDNDGDTMHGSLIANDKINHEVELDTKPAEEIQQSTEALSTLASRLTLQQCDEGYQSTTCINLPEPLPLPIPNNQLYYYTVNVDGFLSNLSLYTSVQQIFLCCTECIITDKTVCPHTSAQEFVGLKLFKEEIIQRKYGHFFAGDAVSNLITVNAPAEISTYFEAFKVKGDGNCYYSALSITLCLDTVLGKALRKASFLSVKFDNNLRILLSNLRDDEKQALLDNLALSGHEAWAYHHSIYVSSYIIERPVQVYYQNKNDERIRSTLYNATSSTEQPVYIWLDKNANHFSPLLLRSPKIIPPFCAYELPEFRGKMDRNQLNEYLNKVTSSREIIEVADLELNSSNTDYKRQSEDTIPEMEGLTSKDLTCDLVSKTINPKGSSVASDVERVSEINGSINEDVTSKKICDIGDLAELSLLSDLKLQSLENASNKEDVTSSINGRVNHAVQTSALSTSCVLNGAKETNRSMKPINEKKPQSEQLENASAFGKQRGIGSKSQGTWADRSSTKLNLFQSKNLTYYSTCLKHFKVELEDFLHKTDDEVIGILKKYVYSTEPWDFYLKRMMVPRKLAPSRVHEICRSVCRIQSKKEGRIKFAEMLQESGFRKTIIAEYLTLCDEKLGKLTLPILWKSDKVLSNGDSTEEESLPHIEDNVEIQNVALKVTENAKVTITNAQSVVGSSAATKMQIPVYEDSVVSENPASVKQEKSFSPRCASPNTTTNERDTPTICKTGTPTICNTGTPTICNTGTPTICNTGTPTICNTGTATLGTEPGVSKMAITGIPISPERSENIVHVDTDDKSDALVEKREDIKSRKTSPETKTARLDSIHTPEIICSEGSSQEEGDSDIDGKNPIKYDSTASKMFTSPSKRPVFDILNVSASDLEPKHPGNFLTTITPTEIEDFYDYKKSQFHPRSWPILIDQAFILAGKACCFNATKTIYYYSERSNKFCKMVGKCAGPCEVRFVITFDKKPEEGMAAVCEVKSSGVFKLIQGKTTGREIRSLARSRLKEQLKHRKANAVYLESLLKVNGVRMLHRNLPQKSLLVLRKIKSEMKKDKRLHPIPAEELELMAKKFREQDDEKRPVKGYIQYYNLKPKNFQVHMYSFNSLQFHAQQVKLGYTCVYFDSSGDFIAKLLKKRKKQKDGVTDHTSNPTQPQPDNATSGPSDNDKVNVPDAKKTDTKKKTQKAPLLYILMGKTKDDITYPIGEFLSERGTNIDVSTCLERLRYDMVKVNKNSERLFSHVVTVDWSFAMLHGVCKGINTQEIVDYIRNSWDLLEGCKDWDKRHACVTICTSHLLQACKQLFARKVKNPRQDRKIISVALDAVARIQETFTMHEFRKALAMTIKMFGKEYMSPDELKTHLAYLKERKQELPHDSSDDESEDSDDYDFDDIPLEKPTQENDTLRSQSKFYTTFLDIQKKVLVPVSGSSGVEKNPYYNTEILSAIGEIKIPFYPFWGAAVPRHAHKIDNFIRESNAVVESSFHGRKNNYLSEKHQLYTDYIRESETYHQASLRNAALKTIPTWENIPTQLPNPKSILNVENWSHRRNSQSRTKHVSQKPTSRPHTQPLQHGKETTNASTDTASSKPDLKNLLRSGLPNIGNTCYLNAVVQSLCVLPVLEERFWEGNLPSPLQEFYRRVSTSATMTEMEYGKLKAIIDDLTNHQFPTGTQHCAFSFVRCLLDSSQMSFLQTKMAIDLICENVCTKCTYVYQKPETEYEIIIQPNKFTNDAIIDAFRPETIKNSRCEMCQSPVTRKRNVIATSEYVMILTTATAKTGGRVVKKDIVQQRFKQISNQIKIRTVTGTHDYELKSFIAHEGDSVISGHYRAYIPLGTSKYLCFDDDKIYGTLNHRGDVRLQIYQRIE